MNLLEQPQVVCTIKLWYQLFFRGRFGVGGITRKIEVCVIIGNIFVNTQSILMIVAPKRYVFNDYYKYRKILLQCLSYEGQQRSQPHVTVNKQMFRHHTICTFLSFV